MSKFLLVFAMYWANTDFLHCFLDLVYIGVLCEFKRFVGPRPADIWPTHARPPNPHTPRTGFVPKPALCVGKPPKSHGMCSSLVAIYSVVYLKTQRWSWKTLYDKKMKPSQISSLPSQSAVVKTYVFHWETLVHISSSAVHDMIHWY